MPMNIVRDKYRFKSLFGGLSFWDPPLGTYSVHQTTVIKHDVTVSIV